MFQHYTKKHVTCFLVLMLAAMVFLLCGSLASCQTQAEEPTVSDTPPGSTLPAAVSSEPSEPPEPETSPEAPDISPAPQATDPGSTAAAPEAESTPAPKASPAAPSPSPEQTKSQSSAPATALDSYRAVLLGEAQFLYVADGSTERSVTIADVPAIFSPSSQYAQIDQFVVLDLDGDGEKEVVLHIGDVANDMGGYLILHQADGKTYGFPSDYRTFWELKTDGTFQYSYNGSEDGIAFIRFTEMGYVMDKIIYAKGTVPYNPDTFIVNNQSVTQEEYDAAIEQQRKKPDAQWREFTDENIRAALS